uniref:Zinc finger protein 425-like protein n=1 Tax=Triatoma infestans TaxID=30076 RepID=A0A170TXL3_TRIIF
MTILNIIIEKKVTNNFRTIYNSRN